jgi:cyclin-dependent kinase 8/11
VNAMLGEWHAFAYLEERWPGIETMPEFSHLSSLRQTSNNLKNVFYQTSSAPSDYGFQLLSQMLDYDPSRRITADEALQHPYFMDEPRPSLK